jgi:hypothetical protein
VDNIITYKTIVSCILCIHLVPTYFTKYVVTVLEFLRRIDEAEDVIV